jgi:hypothetical protein
MVSPQFEDKFQPQHNFIQDLPLNEQRIDDCASSQRIAMPAMQVNFEPKFPRVEETKKKKIFIR